MGQKVGDGPRAVVGTSAGYAGLIALGVNPLDAAADILPFSIAAAVVGGFIGLTGRKAGPKEKKFAGYVDRLLPGGTAAVVTVFPLVTDMFPEGLPATGTAGLITYGTSRVLTGVTKSVAGRGNPNKPGQNQHRPK